MTAERVAKLETRVDSTEVEIKEINQSLKSIDGSLQALAVLAEKHQESKEAINRAFQSINKIETRVSALEQTVAVNSVISKGLVGGSRLLIERVMLFISGVAVAVITWLLNK
jgi:uncharacterized coiled-coil protein SlyX